MLDPSWLLFNHSVLSDPATPWTIAHQASLSFTIPWSLLKLMSIESVMPSNHLILCCPFLLLPSVFQHHGLFQWVSSSHQVAKASASALPVDIQGWFPFRLTGSISEVQGALKSLLQHRNSKTSIFQHSAYFRVQLSHPYMTTGKTIALTIQTFVGKVMSLVFNKLSRYVIVFLLRNKCLLISWLHSLTAVILEPKKIVCHCFHCFPIYFPWSDGTTRHDLCFLNVEF